MWVHTVYHEILVAVLANTTRGKGIGSCCVPTTDGWLNRKTSRGIAEC
jgi:hypothetical protein